MREESEQEETPEPGWRERLWALGSALGRVAETRAKIFQVELQEKARSVGKAFAALVVALLFFVIAGLLLTALLAAVLSKLLGGPVLGILATLVLYLAVAGAAGYFGIRNLSRFRPFEFPATRREIDRDLEAVRRAAGVCVPGEPEPAEAERAPVPSRLESAAEIEARLREGAG